MYYFETPYLNYIAVNKTIPVIMLRYQVKS